jgi:hypothetical protein
VYSGQPAAVTIEVPLVALVTDNAAVMPLTEAGAGPDTRGQYAKHAAEQAECPGLSEVSRYTVKPLPSTRTGPSDVVATPSTPPGAAGMARAGAPEAAEGVVLVLVLVPHAAASMRAAAAPSRLTVVVERDMATSR